MLTNGVVGRYSRPMRYPTRALAAAVLAATLVVTTGAAPPEDLLTVAETSGFRATATHAEVMALIARLDARGEHVYVGSIGATTEGRDIPLIVIADPPVRSAAEARASGKPILFAFGDIHAGEVCGKEALLMLARELALDAGHDLLDDLVIALAPIYNGDGNDRMNPNNRRGQVGPELGMGERPNAQGLDLNRDWMKLESPEARAMVAFLTEWDPHVTIDTHTTDGSYHRYTLTYAAPQNPSGHEPPIAFIRDELLPEVTNRLRTRTGYETFFYGNFNRDRTAWSTYSAEPRFGCPYRGLRGQMAILSEAYAYASYEDRVRCTLEFVREIGGYVAERRNDVLRIREETRAAVIAAGANPQPSDMVGIRHRLAAYVRPAEILGWEETSGSDGHNPTSVPTTYTVVHNGRFEPTVSVSRPYAYLIPAGLEHIADKLRQHGATVEPFEGAAIVEQYTVTNREEAGREFQGHRALTVDVESSVVEATLPPASMIVRTGQPLGTLIVYLLEPRSEDGLATWNFLDDRITVGEAYPILRVARERDLPVR